MINRKKLIIPMQEYSDNQGSAAEQVNEELKFDLQRENEELR